MKKISKLVVIILLLFGITNASGQQVSDLVHKKVGLVKSVISIPDEDAMKVVSILDNFFKARNEILKYQTTDTLRFAKTKLSAKERDQQLRNILNDDQFLKLKSILGKLQMSEVNIISHDKKAHPQKK